MARDLRRYARQTTIRLLVGGLLLVFVIGDGLIYIFYGPGAAVMGFICLLIGVFPLLLIILVFLALDRLVKLANKE
ncbi:MAG TPA: hypothetical protein ENI27_08830 [bacterium]|nr:hypothetical protein [bacterium]